MQSRFILLAFPLSLFAQNGVIQGVVKDQTDALIPSVQVTATNLETGLRREVSTNEAGVPGSNITPGAGTINSAGEPRRVQFGLKIVF